MKNVAIPRTAADRGTIPHWQQAHDAIDQIHGVVEEFDVNVPVRRSSYTPATDPLLKLWLDATDSNLTSVQNTVGAAIANGATAGQWSSKAGAARNFVQWGANGRPTWQLNGINGLPALLFNNQILTNQIQTDFQSMTSFACMVVAKRVSGSGVTFGLTELDIVTGFSDITIVQVYSDPSFFAGGRRARGSIAGAGDHFQGLGGHTATPVAVTTFAADYSNAKAWLYENGAPSVVGVTFQAPGTTDPAEPYAISVGGFAQQTGTAIGIPVNAYIGEVLAWAPKYALLADDLAPAHDYLRRKWIGSTDPVMRVSEATELISAYLTPDSVSGATAATQQTFGIYRFDQTGSSATAKLLASIDGTASSSTAWSAYRAKPMLVSSERILLKPGDTLALSSRVQFDGALTMRFRRSL